MLEKKKMSRMKKLLVEDERMDESSLKSRLKGVSIKNYRDFQRKDYRHRPKAPPSSYF